MPFVNASFNIDLMNVYFVCSTSLFIEWKKRWKYSIMIMVFSLLPFK